MFWTCGSFRDTQLLFHSVNIATIYGDISGCSLLEFRMLK
jgi:hypothetical protein